MICITIKLYNAIGTYSALWQVNDMLTIIWNINKIFFLVQKVLNCDKNQEIK
jgi:hypothetical protein